MNKNEKRPAILICSELTSILEHNINEMEEKLYKIKDDSSLRAPIFLYSYAMFEGAITMLMTKFCSAFPEKIPKEIFSGIEKQDLIDNISNREAIDNIVEKFVMKVTYGNIEQLMKQLNNILGICVMCDSEVLVRISEIRNCLTHNNGIINRRFINKCSNKKKAEIGKKIVLSESYVKEAISFLKKILNDIKNEVERKYSKYNKEKLIRSMWRYLFSTTLLESLWGTFPDACVATSTVIQ